MIVVSDIGEQWSPNNAPESTQAIAMEMNLSVSSTTPLSRKLLATGIAIGIAMNSVPMDFVGEPHKHGPFGAKGMGEALGTEVASS